MSQVTVNFQATQTQQIWTVPGGVSAVTMQCWGAFGGDRGPAVGTASFAGVGYTSGIRAVQQGQMFYIYVGGQGKNQQISSKANQIVSAPGGWNGGGAGGSAATNNSQVWRVSGNGGGGATDIRYGGNALSNRIMVAGGAGGSSQNGFFNATDSSSSPEQNLNPNAPNPPYTGNTNDWYYNTFQDRLGGTGGFGGGLTAQWGGPSTTATTLITYGSGGPGGPRTGGRGSILKSRGANDGTSGALGQGGSGGSVASSDAATYGLFYGGGGGGGGYYGGGGGATDFGKLTTIQGANGGGGGGGGSNYIGGGFANPQNLAHTQNPLALAGGSYFDGYATLTYDQPPNTPWIKSPINYTSFDVARPLTITWVYSSNDRTTHQQGFEVDYQIQGQSTWKSFPTIASKNGFYSFPANTFQSGQTYNFRIRYFDNTGDPSPFATLQLTATSLSPAPTITAPTPGAIISNSTFPVSWTPPANEALVRLLVKDDDGDIIYSSGDIASTRVNLCTAPNADGSLSANGFGGVGSWTLQPTTNGGSITASADYNARGVSGGKSYKIAWGSTSDPSYKASLRWINTVPGETYNVSLGYAKSNASGPEVQLSISGGSLWMGDTSTLGTQTGVFQQLTCQFVASTTFAFIDVSTNSPTVSGTDFGYIDAILVEQGVINQPAPNSFASYFDGNNANGQSGTVSWLGFVGNSASALTPTSPLSSIPVTWYLDKTTEGINISLSYTTTSSNGMWSSIATEHATVNLNPPATPVVSIFSNNDEGAIYLEIKNPDTLNATNPTAYNDVYRQDMTNGGDQIRIATDVPVNSTFVDYTPATETTYEYTVRAISSSGGFADNL